MQPLAVDLVLLRAGAPDVALTPGRSLMARVLERGPSNVGIINLAGAILTAELPAHVQAGDRLRLVVRETTGDRVIFGVAPPLAQQPAQPGLVPPAPAEVRWPLDGGSLALLEREAGAGAGDAAGSITLRWEAPALGPVQLRIALDGGGVRAQVTLAPGLPLELGERAAAALRARLAHTTKRPATVVVGPLRRPVDLYA
jgi:hypothetical protein